MGRITLADAWKEIGETDPALWLGALAAIIVFVIKFQLYKKGLIFSVGEKSWSGQGKPVMSSRQP